MTNSRTSSQRITQLNAVTRTLKLLSEMDRKKLLVLTIIQSLVGLLDLLGIFVVGVLGSLAVTGVQSRVPNSNIATILNYLGISAWTFQNQAMILGIAASLILILKSFISAGFSRYTLKFLSNRAALISTETFGSILQTNYLQLRKFSPHEITYGLTIGVSTLLLGIIGVLVNLITDIFLFSILVVSLFLLNPLIGMITTFLFAAVGYLMYILLHKKVRGLGQQEVALNISSNLIINESLNSFKEIYVNNTQMHYVGLVGNVRSKLANVLAENAFIPNLNKYVIESTLVFTAVIITAVEFLISDSTNAVAGIAVVLASGSRIAPAILRIQQGSLLLRGALGSADSTFAIMDLALSTAKEVMQPSFVPQALNSSISISNVKFRYPDSEIDILRGISFNISQGEHVALVGPSGVGKSTLADLILGIITPNSGEISISGEDPSLLINNFPGFIAYVAQDIYIHEGTLRDNLLMGRKGSFADQDFHDCLKKANLSLFVNELPAGLDTPLGSKGFQLSGGQKQRLSLARAFLTSPRILILDEPTSALDGKTEFEISETIRNLESDVTVVLIAHRLSSIRDFDKVALLEDGMLRAFGTISEVKSASNDFNEQAILMGL